MKVVILIFVSFANKKTQKKNFLDANEECLNLMYVCCVSYYFIFYNYVSLDLLLYIDKYIQEIYIVCYT